MRIAECEGSTRAYAAQICGTQQKCIPDFPHNLVALHRPGAISDHHQSKIIVAISDEFGGAFVAERRLIGTDRSADVMTRPVCVLTATPACKGGRQGRLYSQIGRLRGSGTRYDRGEQAGIPCMSIPQESES